MSWTGPSAVRDDYYGAPAHLKSSIAAASPAQVRCDSILSEVRARPRPSIRRDPPPVPPPPAPTDDVLSLRLAEELEYALRMLDTKGDE
jgi:hypothetical protein